VSAFEPSGKKIGAWQGAALAAKYRPRISATHMGIVDLDFYPSKNCHGALVLPESIC
jgi:hypothetical protein